MSSSGDNLFRPYDPDSRLFLQAKREQHATKPSALPTQPMAPVPPPNLKQTIAGGLQNSNAAAQAVASAAAKADSIANSVANPGAALAAAGGAAADEKMGQLVSGLAAAMGAFPAATLTGLAMGVPHAHVKHPPSGPPPLPPIPLPPLGPIMLGTNLTVLINNKPTARCGDYGLNPTCCGIVPPLSALFQIVTGSSNVYIGGSRAARSGIDITMHCFNMPSPKVSIKLGKLAGIAGKAGKAAGAAGKVAAVTGKAASVAGKVAQANQIASSFADAEAKDDAAMAAAIGLSVAMMAAQAAADAAAAAMTKMMGTDQPCIPPVGTPGMILMGSPNVMIGGFPLPSFSAIAQGLLKRVKGLKIEAGKSPGADPRCAGGKPINFITGACFDNYVDFERDGPIRLKWERFYDSRWSKQSGPFGPGFRHSYQRELRRTLEGFEYITQKGDAISFPDFKPGQNAVASHGFLLRNSTRGGVFVLEELGQCQMEFAMGGLDVSVPLRTLRQGNAEVQFRYDNHGRLSAIRDSQLGLIVITSDVQGRITQVRLSESDGRRERLLAGYVYNSVGDLVRFQDALGNFRTYTYDAFHRMTCNTDRRGYATFNEYDTEGRCVREYCVDGLYDVRVEYLPESRCAIATYADGATATYFQDADGNPTEVIERSGGKIIYQRGTDGRLLRELDPLGNVTEIVYDAWGGQVGRVNPLGYFLPPTFIDPNPPNPLAYTLPQTVLEWEHGVLIERNQMLQAGYDDPVLSRYPINIVNSILGPTTAVAARGAGPAPAARKIFDLLGRLVEEVDERGHVQRWMYDPEGNVVEHQDRDGSTNRFVYKSWNLLAEKISPSGGITRFDYSIRGDPTRVIDANGTITEYINDHWDRLIEVRRHGRIRERYRYDVADNLIEKTDGEGRALLTFKVVPGNLHGARHLATGENHYFEYDDRGRFTIAATDRFAVTFAYDTAGRLLKDFRDGVGVEHHFVARRLAATKFLGRFTVRYQYGEDKIKITDPTGAVHCVRFSAGGVISREFSNGRTELARYSVDGRCLSKIGTERFQNRIHWRNLFAYSPHGDLLEVVDHTGARTRYAYDASHRLVQETLPDGTGRKFEHDWGGNLILQPDLTGVVLQEGNRLVAANGDGFVYNDRNHICSRHGPRGTVRYEYNALDMLTAIDINGERWTAEYDPLGRRVNKTWKGETTRYYWDDCRLAAEERPNGSLRLYVYESEATLVPLLFIEYHSRDAEPESGKTHFVFSNQIGVPVRVEDDHGEIVWQARIDPFGVAQVNAGSTIDMPLRFPGHYFDKETKQHYNRFRYYDPSLGRYLQSDPYGIAGGINLYAYCPNPLTTVDLDGLTHPKQPGPTESGGKEGPNKEKGPGEGEKEGAPSSPKKQRTASQQALQDKADRIRYPSRDGDTSTLTVTEGKVKGEVVYTVTTSRPSGLTDPEINRAHRELGGKVVCPAPGVTRAPGDSGGHSEQRGIEATKDQTERRQASSNQTVITKDADPDPKKYRQDRDPHLGHLGAACSGCARAQRDATNSEGKPNPVENVTGTIEDGGRMSERKK